MRISARNILAGKIDNVMPGAVNTEVDLTLEGGEKIASIITAASAVSLGLKPGGSAFVIVKANEVIIGKDIDSTRISARNLISGKVSRIEAGAVNCEVSVTLSGGSTLVAMITKSSVDSLHLAVGDSVSAIIKASNVIIGVN